MKINIYVNGNKFKVNSGLTIIKALETLNIRLNRYCYNERLGISGNCRSCIVEVKNYNKLVIGCLEKVSDNMEIFTDSSLIKKRKEGILEFLLKNHPLDCPVCDQAGECDLQEGSMVDGNSLSRFYNDNKRKVKIKDFGLLVSSSMSKCISCSRCIRYITDILGNSYLGLLGRSDKVEINNYEELGSSTKLSGNVIDLCPVGLLV